MTIAQTEIESFAVEIVENFAQRMAYHAIPGSEDGSHRIRDLALVDVYDLIGHLTPPESLAVMNRVTEIMAGQRLATQGNA
jgi:hypothetical protein